VTFKGIPTIVKGRSILDIGVGTETVLGLSDSDTDSHKPGDSLPSLPPVPQLLSLQLQSIIAFWPVPVPNYTAW